MRLPVGGHCTISGRFGPEQGLVELVVYDDALELVVTTGTKPVGLLMTPEDAVRLEKLCRAARRAMPAPERDPPVEMPEGYR